MIEEGEIIEIPVQNPNDSSNAKQPEIGIIVLSFSVFLFVLAIFIKNWH